MRWLIATAAFIVPILIITHLAMASLGSVQEPAIGGAGIAELRSWLIAKREVIEHYAPAPGQEELASMPHLALDRFDRAGCDPQGNPWFRLAEHPAGVRCGVLRRAAPDRHVSPDGRKPRLLLRLAGEWLYWECPEVLVPTPQSRP